ncbi:MAG: DUF2971 domain-containing protein [Muribaculaceae bacterium]
MEIDNFESYKRNYITRLLGIINNSIRQKDQNSFEKHYNYFLNHISFLNQFEEKEIRKELINITSAFEKLYTPEEAINKLDDLSNNIHESQINNVHISIARNQMALLYLMLDNEIEAYKHLSEFAYYHFVGTSHYDGYEYFSFRSFSDYSLRDIENNTLTVSHPGTFNDPMDTIIFKWNLYLLEKKNVKDAKLNKKRRLLLKRVYDHIKVRCFVRTKSLPKGIDDIDNIVHEKQNIEDVNPLMWAHYSKNHTGFCIKYRFKDNFVCNADPVNCICTQISNVEYKESMIFKNRGSFTINDALFAKHKIWKYENEVRLVHFDPTNSSNFKAIKHPDDSIIDIYLGLKCSDEDRNKMLLILRNRNIKLYQMKIDPNDCYKLIKERIL